ncbi:S-adenosylmethionine decarboxylase [Schizophyllum amplum]|uniref:adenosylmethionine decarboxylase n=1 Tax=Schizophyllum amplum TaxID=97359 RepID=A0A550CXY0_9AGAR|nr:S-adenosylmethionine decarboxylase [Auriculariopsis ampla]
MTDTLASDIAQAPFEGPEKLLEIWFAESPAHVPDAVDPKDPGRTGLRAVPRSVWEDMLDIVKCKVLSVVEGAELDAYLLSESSLFISPHRLILKTCGTTLNLLGLPRILAIAREQANLPTVHRCFYSRKSFMFPERQHGPHRDWKYEVEFLDAIFDNGAAYTVGKMNGDHWLLYMTGAAAPPSRSSKTPRSVPRPLDLKERTDSTIEILMSDLAPDARAPFLSAPTDLSPMEHAQALSESIGIASIFPASETVLDAYSFTPCGYSSNALIGSDGYFTIHVTPEAGWSYASFECNVPVPAAHASGAVSDARPDLKTLIRRVARIFQPGRLSVTLFVSSDEDEDEDELSAVEAAQKAFKAALTLPDKLEHVNGAGEAEDGGGVVNGAQKVCYRRTDKINYEFEGYELAFASFELC